MTSQPYNSVYYKEGVFNHPTIALYVFDMKSETEEHQEQFEYWSNKKREHPSNALCWVRFTKHDTRPIWIVREIQSDVMSRHGLCATIYNRYKDWYKWALSELIDEARRQGIEQIYIPTALQIYHMYVVYRKLEKHRVRKSPEIFDRDLDKFTEAWQRIYDSNAQRFGGSLQRVYGNEENSYLRIDDTRIICDYMFVIDLTND